MAHSAAGGGGTAPPALETTSLRPTSYVLVSEATDDNEATDPGDTDDDGHDGNGSGSGGDFSILERPRFWFVMPTLAALDVTLACVIGFTILDEERQRQGDKIGLVSAMMACALARDSAVAIVGFSRNIRNLTITIAAICLVSGDVQLNRERSPSLRPPHPDVNTIRHVCAQSSVSSAWWRLESSSTWPYNNSLDHQHVDFDCFGVPCSKCRQCRLANPKSNAKHATA